MGVVVPPASPSRGLLYAVGGFHCEHGPAHTRSLASVEVYDIATDTWTNDSALPGPNALLVPVRVDDTSFLVVGGFNGTSGGDMDPADLLRPIYQLHIHSLQPHSRRNRPNISDGGSSDVAASWTLVSALPEARGFPAAALTAEGELLAIGGYNAKTRDDSALVQTLD